MKKNLLFFGVLTVFIVVFYLFFNPALNFSGKAVSVSKINSLNNSNSYVVNSLFKINVENNSSVKNNITRKFADPLDFYNSYVFLSHVSCENYGYSNVGVFKPQSFNRSLAYVFNGSKFDSFNGNSENGLFFVCAKSVNDAVLVSGVSCPSNLLFAGRWLINQSLDHSTITGHVFNWRFNSWDNIDGGWVSLCVNKDTVPAGLLVTSSKTKPYFSSLNQCPPGYFSSGFIPTLSGVGIGSYMGVKNGYLKFCSKVDNAPVDPWCGDNILNGGETEVDCGGPCNSCKWHPNIGSDYTPEEYEYWLGCMLGTISASECDDFFKNEDWQNFNWNCGDDVCQSWLGEDSSCSDCSNSSTCPDGYCDCFSELEGMPNACAQDCWGCGDGCCDYYEAMTCNESECRGDGYCGDAWCDTVNEDSESCPLDCSEDNWGCCIKQLGNGYDCEELHYGTCFYLGGTWVDGSCQSKPECQNQNSIGCCVSNDSSGNPVCVETTEADCDYGNWVDASCSQEPRCSENGDSLGCCMAQPNPDGPVYCSAMTEDACDVVGDNPVSGGTSWVEGSCDGQDCVQDGGCVGNIPNGECEEGENENNCPDDCCICGNNVCQRGYPCNEEREDIPSQYCARDCEDTPECTNETAHEDCGVPRCSDDETTRINAYCDNGKCHYYEHLCFDEGFSWQNHGGNQYCGDVSKCYVYQDEDDKEALCGKPVDESNCQECEDPSECGNLSCVIDYDNDGYLKHPLCLYNHCTYQLSRCEFGCEYDSENVAYCAPDPEFEECDPDLDTCPDSCSHNACRFNECVKFGDEYRCVPNHHFKQCHSYVQDCDLSNPNVCECVPTCFVAGTKVKTINGEKNIENIKEGDLVFSYSTDLNIGIVASVNKLLIHEGNFNVLKIILNNGVELTVTPEHRFYLPKKNKWVHAENLIVGDELLFFNSLLGREVNSKIISIKNAGKVNKVYNIHTTHETHNYFANGILVHNTK